jgi:two-component system sensor histidine kinase BaeS
MTRPPSLATRLSLAIGGAVAVVILAAGVLVAVGVLGRFDAYLDAARRDRYEEVAAAAADLVAERGGLDLRKQELRQLAVAAGGPIEIRDPAGVVVARLDSLPGIGTGPPASRPLPESAVAVPIVIDGREVGSLVVRPFAGASESAASAPTGFRETATLILLAAGLGAVLASIAVAWLLARRLTRPLRDLATASRRIGAGDLGTRVALPPDAEGRDLGIAFNAMAENLERSERLRRRAASDLAHELATPVTVLAGRLQALSDGVIEPRPAELAATRDAADEVKRLVADLQELAAAEGAALQRTVERVDLVELARGAVAASLALFADAGVELAGPADGAAPVPIEVDPRQVGRCLANVLTNAATYTPRGGRVEVQVGVDGGLARARVRDTGPGIADEHLPHVFERYYRVDPSRRRAPGTPGGTGIGLTVARELAVANGGRLFVEETGPSGTTFALELPVAS